MKHYKKIHVKDEYMYIILYRKPVIEYALEAELRYIKTPITQVDPYGHWAELTYFYPIDTKGKARYIPDKVIDVWTLVKYNTMAFYTTNEERFEQAKKEVGELIHTDYEEIKALYESMRRLITSAGNTEVEYEFHERYFEPLENKDENEEDDW